MNILPKKSWHVRTKANIARVRRDEAKAAEEEKETQRKIALAAQEARTALLRERASKRLAEASTSFPANVDNDGDDSSVTNGNNGSGTVEPPPDLRFGLPLASLRDVVQHDGHVNFFQDEESGKRQGGVNNEHEDEKRKEQEEYEKKIGYLVYLGQDSLEHSKQMPWYSKIERGKGDGELEKEKEKCRELDRASFVAGGLEEKSKTVSIEDIKMTKSKSLQDPLKDIRKYLGTPGVTKKMTASTSIPTKDNQFSSPAPPAKRKRTEDSSKRHHKKEKRKKHKKDSKKSKKHKKSSKHKRKSSSSSESDNSEDEGERTTKSSKLEQLRAERLRREREEKKKAEQVLARLRGEVTPSSNDSNEKSSSANKKDGGESSTYRVKQKYNSQFNPHLARQNFD